MNTYSIWVDLAPGVKDLDFSEAVGKYLSWHKEQGNIEAWRLQRRKLGFGPPGLAEWHIQVDCLDLAQLDKGFFAAAERKGISEDLHADVYRKVARAEFGLYRDFPDPVRVKS